MTRADQVRAIQGSGAQLAATICVAAILGCVASAGVAVVALEWIDHGGICPVSKPYL